MLSSRSEAQFGLLEILGENLMDHTTPGPLQKNLQTQKITLILISYSYPCLATIPNHTGAQFQYGVLVLSMRGHTV